MMPMGGLELLIILAIILLFFGAKRIPEVARSLGKAKHEMQKEMEEAEAKDREEREKAEARQNKEESPPPAKDREDGRVPEEETPKAGPGAKA